MSRALHFAALLVAAVIFQVSPAAAIDGEFLITQEKALAGNVAPGDRPGYPISIDFPGSYKLAGNLVASGDAGIAVRGDHVTIDFAGFRLGGGGTARNGIVSSGGAVDLTIRNGAIQNFSKNGITCGDICRIENMRIRLNQEIGVFALRGTIENNANTLVTIRGSQIVENGRGVWSPFVMMQNSVVTDNLGVGVTASFGQIENSIIARNSTVGLALLYGTVLGNTIVNNGSFGLSGSPPVGYGNNTFFGNGNAQVAEGTQLHPNVCQGSPC